MKKLTCIILSVVLLSAVCLPLYSSAAEKQYTIVSPYADVVWNGDGAWKACKGNLHTHSTVSDAEVDYPTMIKEYYEQGFDFLAMSDHGVTGVEWNKKQTVLPLYTYQKIIGNSVTQLTDEEFYGITSGTYPMYDGTVRGSSMTCVTGANELNNLTLTKCHVNGYFLPAGVGDNFGGRENGFEQAIKFVEENDGLSHINHPGDWIESNYNPDSVNNPEFIELFSELLLKYKTCLGMEVFNEDNGTTGYDRMLWDNLLMSVLPYGRTVIGFSNGDAHDLKNVDSSFSVFMMTDNSVENVKATMQSGAFFAVTRNIRANSTLGPSEPISAMNTDIPYPIFTSVDVNNHTVTVTAENFNKIQWVANGKIIYEQNVSEADAGKPITLNLDEIENAEDLLYVRAELFGEGGMCLTQALTIDNGSAPLTYEEDTSIKAFFKDVLDFLKSSRLWVILVELYRAVR